MTALDRQTIGLLRAVVGPREERRPLTIPDLAANISDWEEVIASAQQHGILPMLYSKLAANEDLVPASALEIVRREFERNAFFCLANATELLEVLKAFQEAEIAAIPIKGVLLGA